MLGAALGVAIVAMLVMVALASLSVVRHLVLLKRRTSQMAESQLFVAVAAAQSDFKSLDASMTALIAQAVALKNASEHVRASVQSLAQIRQTMSLGAFKAQLRDLLNVLR